MGSLMNSKKMERALLGLIAVLTVALLWTIYDGIRERNVLVGDTAPAFSVVTDSGKTVTRSDFGGKVLVLNFWATWCPPCIEELPSLNQFQKEMAASGVVVLGVSVDKNENVYKNFLKRNGVVFETVRDPKTEISAEYGTYKYPETYVIDAMGKVRQKHIGQVNWMDPTVVSSIKGLL
ncbi:MAG: TlpA disulfide reductase family protein [Bryobacteraceae bacterium]|nr:TlpA disulfide reductase family protein [Bryobacteraceae bacterium]